MDPLRVKWWGPNELSLHPGFCSFFFYFFLPVQRVLDPIKLFYIAHLLPSYICELSLHQKFQSPTITPSHKKAGDYVCGKVSNDLAKK